MEWGTRDKVVHLQLSILQDYFEIKMLAAYGDQWLDEVFKVCEKKGKQDGTPNQHSYQHIIEKRKKEGVVMVTKKAFDVTLLNSFLLYDFKKDCYANPEETDVYWGYIKAITNDKNSLISHPSDITDHVMIAELIGNAIYDLSKFVTYLERLGWASGDEKQQKFIRTYIPELQRLSEEIFGKGNLPKVSISIAIKDAAGNYVPNYGLRLLNSRNEREAQWTSSRESFSILLVTGDYTIESTKTPKGYQNLSQVSIHVEKSDENKEYPIVVERSISKEELYEEAFDGLAYPDKREQSLATLESLAKDNYLPARLMLAFFLDSGLYQKQDQEKAKSLIIFAGFQESEATWMPKADSLLEERKYREAIPYYLGHSLQSGSGDGYHMAGRILIKKVKNYELCTLCFKLAMEHGEKEAKIPYEKMCRISKEGYLRSK